MNWVTGKTYVNPLQIISGFLFLLSIVVLLYSSMVTKGLTEVRKRVL